jgi:hypothetical protein
MSGQSQQQQQQLQQGGPQGMMPVGMGRGASNTGLQGSVLALANHVGGGQPSQNPQHLMQGDVSDNHNVLLLNSYIYDHLVKHGFYKAAKGLLQETSVLTTPRGQDDSSPNQDNDGNLLARRATGLKRSHSGMDDHPNSSPNDKPNGKSPRSTSNSPHIGNNDLPAPNVPLDSSGGFLSEWWAVFWDVFAARSNHNDATPYAQAYLDNQVSYHLTSANIAQPTTHASISRTIQPDAAACSNDEWRC